MTLGKLLNLSEFQFSYLQNGENNTFLTGDLEDPQEAMYIRLRGQTEAYPEQPNSFLCFWTRSYLVLNGIEIRCVAKPLIYLINTQTLAEQQLWVNYAQN